MTLSGAGGQRVGAVLYSSSRVIEQFSRTLVVEIHAPAALMLWTEVRHTETDSHNLTHVRGKCVCVHDCVCVCVGAHVCT